MTISTKKHKTKSGKLLQVFLLLLSIFPLSFSSCTLSAEKQSTITAVTEGPEHGHLIVAGGNLSDPSVFKKFMDLAGGPDAPIVIVSTARTDEEIANPEFYLSQKHRFESFGFTNFSFLHTRSRDTANMDHFTSKIHQARGLWFLGGRQWRLVDAYAETHTLQAMNDLLDRGGVIGGSSAGATIQGSFLARGDTKTNTLMVGDHKQGFGFISNVAIDQHVLAMNRQFDIFDILDRYPNLLGLGLDENTAIVVHGNEFEVLGKSYVAIYDGTFYREVRDKDDWAQVVGEISPLTPDSRKFYLLKSGQRYDLKNRKVISK